MRPVGTHGGLAVGSGGTAGEAPPPQGGDSPLNSSRFNTSQFSGSSLAVVRDLARHVADVAADPEMGLTCQRWRDTYMLRRADRPPVWLRLDAMGQRELLPDAELQCSEPFLRAIERELRLVLRHREFGDDTVVLPYWKVPAAIQFDGEHLWGVPVKRRQPGEATGAWAYDPPIRSAGDLDRLRIPRWHHDEAETQRRLNIHAEVFGETLPIRLSALPPIFPGIARNATDLIGLDGLLLNMAGDPDFVHHLMAFQRDSVLQCLDDVEAMGTLTENCDEPIHFSESLKESGAKTPLRLGDLWLRTESQQFQGVSRAMWREFCLEYQKPIMARFRYVSYGCCEDLTDCIDDVLAVPNMRIFVSSPWTDLATTAQHCGDNYSIIWRQKASDVVYAADLSEQRRHLEEGIELTRGCHRAIVLQEVATCNGNPGRLRDWVSLARAIVEGE